MQPRSVQVGPLAAASATKIALAQSPGAAGALVLNGAAGTAVANNICLSQSGTSGTPLIINGGLEQTRYVSPTSGLSGATIAALPIAGPIYITSAGNDSAITFAVVGLNGNGATVTETLHGTNTSVVASVNSYKAILSITPSGNTASTVTVGAMGFATLDTARNVIFTSGGNDSSVTIAISGTDWAGTPISESLAGGNAAAVSTVLDYLTIMRITVSAATATTIEVGTNGIAGSQWINLDEWAPGPVAGQCVGSGTVNYSVETTNDDPNSYGNPVARSAVTWDTTLPPTAVVDATATQSFALAVSPVFCRILLNSESGSGFVRMTLAQNGAVPY